jgi:uncharacterized Zn finger protein (UPF0148 family)
MKKCPYCAAFEGNNGNCYFQAGATISRAFSFFLYAAYAKPDIIAEYKRKSCRRGYSMLEHLCPTCGKISYSADEHGFSPCPYCGFRFSGKYGSDRRREERYKKEVTIVLNYQGQQLEAQSTDFSKEGMGIRVVGETPLSLGETVELSTSDLHIKAKVMWVNKLPSISLVGLQRNLGVLRNF